MRRHVAALVLIALIAWPIEAGRRGVKKKDAAPANCTPPPDVTFIWNGAGCTSPPCTVADSPYQFDDVDEYPIDQQAVWNPATAEISVQNTAAGVAWVIETDREIDDEVVLSTDALTDGIVVNGEETCIWVRARSVDQTVVDHWMSLQDYPSTSTVRMEWRSAVSGSRASTNFRIGRNIFRNWNSVSDYTQLISSGAYLDIFTSGPNYVQQLWINDAQDGSDVGDDLAYNGSVARWSLGTYVFATSVAASNWWITEIFVSSGSEAQCRCTNTNCSAGRASFHQRVAIEGKDLCSEWSASE